jgi:signal transduction histidine kinase
MSVKSTEGNGTRFTVELPLANEKAREPIERAHSKR